MKIPRNTLKNILVYAVALALLAVFVGCFLIGAARVIAYLFGK